MTDLQYVTPGANGYQVASGSTPLSNNPADPLNSNFFTLQQEISALQTPSTTATGTVPANPIATPQNATTPVPLDANGNPIKPEGALSTQEGQLPGTNLTAPQVKAITDRNVENVTNPQVPTAAQATPVNQTAQQGEMLGDQTVNANANQVDTSVGKINASTVANTATAAGPGDIQAAQYQAAQVNAQIAGQATQAVTAALPKDALVSQQLQELLTPDANGNLPAWVQPAVTAANQFLAGRGISNSTMAGQAIMSAILTASIPIAQANASAVLTSFTQNLSNQQAAAMQNGQAFVQTLFNNQSADNAAKNFNATSTNQTNQFVASLATQVNQFNAAQTNAVSQFNSSQTQSAATNSAQLMAQLDQFNANMANQREQFNVQNAIIVQQSNAEYLRAVNTANTAVANQDNQLNAQNAANLSDQAMANLQQQFNDEATMLYNSNMTAEEQNYALTYLSQQYGLQNELDQNITDAQAGQALNNQIGTLAGNLFSPIAGAAGKAVGSIVNSLFTSGTQQGTVSGSAGINNDTGNIVGSNGLGSSGTAPTTDFNSGIDLGSETGGSASSDTGGSIGADFGSFFDDAFG